MVDTKNLNHKLCGDLMKMKILGPKYVILLCQKTERKMKNLHNSFIQNLK